MKKSNLLLSLLVAVTFIAFTTSCKEDPVVVPPSEGLPLPNGFFLQETGADPVAVAQLKVATVDGPGFSAMDRPGFVQGYMYLTAGTYNVVEVKDKAIIKTYGGAPTLVPGADAHNKECDESGYAVIDATLDGGAFSIGTEGLYTVSYDTDLAEIVYDQITSVGIIGGGTPDGWGGDTELLATTGLTADGGSWTGTDITLDVGEMKFRYNCRWAIDRRIDTGEDFDNANGYTVFTNYGNTIDLLLPGNEGPNIQIPEFAKFTVTFSWDPLDGVSATVTRTGDADPKPTYPDAMYLVGDGTAYGWAGPGDASNNGNDAMHKADGGVPMEGVYWKILHLTADTGFKISNVNWTDPNLDHGKVDEWDANGVTVSAAGNDWTVATSGMYTVVLDLRNNMTKVSIIAPEVYGMGPTFGLGDWTEDDATALYTVDNVNKTLVSPDMTGDGTIRSYVQHEWIADWWNAEFVVVSGAIEYRNNSGSDPTAVAGTTGQVQTFHFDDNTGSIN